METKDEIAQRMKEQFKRYYARKDEDCQKMEPQVAKLLWDEAQKVAGIMSGDRDRNQNHETYVLNTLKPLSENTAYAIYDKFKEGEKDPGKKALCILSYIRSSKPTWKWKFITHADLVAYHNLIYMRILLKIEWFNYKLNFDADKRSRIEQYLQTPELPDPEEDIDFL